MCTHTPYFLYPSSCVCIINTFIHMYTCIAHVFFIHSSVCLSNTYLLFHCSIMSDSLQLHELQHIRLL